MIGPIVIVVGLLGLWAVVSGKASGVLDAIVGSGFNASLDNALGNLNLSSASSAPNSGGNSGSPSGSSGVGSDIGTHMGIDNQGNLIVINKAYGDMTDAEKDAANRFAHQQGG